MNTNKPLYNTVNVSIQYRLINIYALYTEHCSPPAVDMFAAVINVSRYFSRRLYKRRHLFFMIALTWLGCFGSLLPTLLGQWGTFGLDKEIGSCSILPDVHHRSPKEFLFVVAFMLPCLAIVVCYARIFFIVRRAAAVSHGQQQQNNAQSTGLKPSASVRSRTGIGGIAPGEMRRGLMLPGSGSGREGGYLKPITGSPSVMEASFHLTCCESQQGSGSTEISEETTERSGQIHLAAPEPVIPKRSGSILRWSKPSPSPIRIEVERGSEATGPLPEFQHLQLPERRRISVSFMEPESENPQPLLQPEAQYLRVPGICAGNNCNNKSPTFGSTKSLSSQLPVAASGDDGEPVLGSPIHSEASSIGSMTPGMNSSSVESRSVLGAALSQVSGALHRRSTRNKSSTRRHPGRMTAKDRKLLQMILVIFVSFIVCYMPITLVKSLSKEVDLGGAVNILGYVLIYLTTCINPIIYVVMSSEYRQAYKNLLTCKQSGPNGGGGGGTGGVGGIGGGALPSRSFSQKAY